MIVERLVVVGLRREKKSDAFFVYDIEPNNKDCQQFLGKVEQHGDKRRDERRR